MKMKKKKLGGQGGCERGIEDFMKMKKKIWGGGGEGRSGGGGGFRGWVRGGGAGRCERRSEVFFENSKKMGGGGVESGGSSWGVRVDKNEELKFLRKLKKIGGGGGGGGGEVGGQFGGRDGWGVQGGCERNVGGRG